MKETQISPPSASGILQCLKMLAEEAASLQLVRTLSAIEDALEMATRESGVACEDEERFFEFVSPVLH